MITSAGVGSGIDIESILTSLMAVERVPLGVLERKKSNIGVQISAFGQIKSSMSAMKDLAVKLGDNTKFGKFVAASSDDEILTAKATIGTIAEEHSINVISLAQVHRMTSAAFTDSTSPVGIGTQSFSSGEESFDIIIDSSNNTLKGLRDAINDSSDNTSISASILNVDGGSRLVLTAKEGGTANQITAPAFFTELTEAIDATFEVDGFPTTSSSNTVSDVIPGITLELKSIGQAQISTQRDLEQLRTTLDDFVGAYNTLRTNLSSNAENTLRGDNIQRTFDQKIRGIFFEPVQSGEESIASAFDLGFTFDKKGVLSIDEDKLEVALEKNIESYVSIFSNPETGFAHKIQDAISNYTEAGGIIDKRKEGLDARTSTLNNQIERFQARLIQTEENYRRKFTAMDQLVSQLRAGSDFLTSQLGSLGN